ncbi:unnamed protein product [Linum tenue]|uniref:Uncharacterized protein n=1 Tax=Linum tenue TaxID=586396 RepID=A0AAV0RYJ4_9ROSI|nr:unnamed protein product [Linum tenue]
MIHFSSCLIIIRYSHMYLTWPQLAQHR